MFTVGINVTNFILVSHHIRNDKLRKAFIDSYISKNCFVVVGMFFDIDVGDYDKFKWLIGKF